MRVSQRREFFVYGHPKAQPRPKAYSRGNKAGVYIPNTAEAWKQLVKDAVERVPPMVKKESSVFEVDLHFYLHRPNSHFETKKAIKGRLKENAKMYCDSKPDCDNLAKAVLDAITDTKRIWNDDAQIVFLNVSKGYELDKEGCGVCIREYVNNEVGIGIAQYVKKGDLYE
jgi:Holliday junction resolvase RusA-like endonuclease